MKLKLIDDWRQAWRFLSLWMHVIGTAAAGAVALVPTMPVEIQAVIPLEYRIAAIALWAAAGIYARLVKQGATHGQ